MGFSAIELNVEVPRNMLGQILSQVKQGNIKVGSIHNFCPKLENYGPKKTIFNAYLISSLDKKERIKAVELTKETINLASEFGAKGVVIHAGEVETDIKGRDLFRYVKDFGKTKNYYLYKNALFREREKKNKLYLQNTIKSLEEIVIYAERLKVKIGIENRVYYNEIPSFEEIDTILQHFKGSNIYYWHDTGHAQIFEYLEFVVSHEELLKRYSDRMLGVHLHDVRILSDHRAPGTGTLNFNMVKKYLSKEMVKVMEVHSKSSKTQLKKSLVFLKNLGF